MRVILKTDIPNLGRAGEIKEVRDGYARNYLIPRNLVIPATPRTEKERAYLELVQKKKIEKRQKTAKEIAEKLNGLEITIAVKTGEEGKLYGSVTNLHIARALHEKGFSIDKKNILLDEAIKNLGDYEIPIKLHEQVQAIVKLHVVAENIAP
ncbi:MAG: 50S ribosomal protein L9 [Leptospiraceae bacterium]|nr:50S ribosomal protein L9 [Leptospiraceae bacterium]MDW8307599.1 50S ribosomal protein L9 [Leptospiraceae bacterium]